MRNMFFTQAIDDALARLWRLTRGSYCLARTCIYCAATCWRGFGPSRVRNTPISESAFLGGGWAAMAGLRPVVELYMVDFLGVCMDALLNQAAKLDVFSGGKWNAPLVVRGPCSGGYGDGGQHEQSLWGWLAHIPGLTVIVPSTPADAGGLLLAALQQDGPVAARAETALRVLAGVPRVGRAQYGAV